MQFATSHSATERRIEIANDGVVQVPVGALSGLLAVRRFSDPFRRFLPSEQWLMVLFSFASEQGHWLQTYSVFDEARLAPSSDDTLIEPEQPFRNHARIMNGLRAGDLPAEFVERVLRPRGADLDGEVLMWFREDERGVHTVLGIRSDPRRADVAHKHGPEFQIQYHIPLERLLWRPDLVVDGEQFRLQAGARPFVRILDSAPPKELGPSKAQVEGAPPPKQAPEPKPISDYYPIDTRRPFGGAQIPEVIAKTEQFSGVERVAYDIPEPIEITLQPDGGAEGGATIGPSRIEGLLCFAQHPGADVEQQKILVVFDFRDEAGRAWRYATILDQWAFTPRDGAEVEVLRETPEGGMTFVALLDSRDLFEHPVPGEAPLKGQFKYTQVFYWPVIHPNASEIEVTANLLCAEDPRAIQDHVPIRYRLPLDRLLWRPAPIVTEEEVIAESAEGVHIEPLDAPLEDLPPSAVRIETKGP